MTKNHFSQILFVALFIPGCSQSTAPPLGTVSGLVKLDGKPLEKATIMFQPESGRPSRGETDRSGRYQLNYTRESRGALPGLHTVNIRTRLEDDSGNIVVEEFLPARYHEKTELSASVDAGKNVIDFNLTSDK